MVHALEFAPAAQTLLRECWRVLRPSGRMVVVVPNRRGIWARVDRTPFGHGNPYSAGQITRLLHRSMFVTGTAETALFAPHGIESPQLDLPIEWQDDLFLPFDWGYFAFVYDKTKVETPPTSFEELADSDLSILIQDPRSSTPGLGLVLWVKAVYGEDAGA